MDSLSSQKAPPLRRATAARLNECLVGQDGQDSGGEEAPERDTYQETLPSADDLDEEEELAEGLRQQDELLERYPLWCCPSTADRLGGILDSMVSLSRRPRVPYEFLALDTETPFASSCCHGAVYFSRGLLQTMSHSGILFFAAHEMAHTELRHYASRQRRLDELRRAIPAPPGSAARQRMELAAVLAVRHQEEFEADHMACRWTDDGSGYLAVKELYGICLRCCPESLTRPTHPPFERRLERLADRLGPPDPVDYLWSLVS
jgi:hypothetical protein